MLNPDGYIQNARNYAAGTPASHKEYLENLPKVCENLSRQTWANLDLMCTQLQADDQLALGLLGALYAKSKSNDFTTHFEPFLVQFATLMESIDVHHMRAGAALVTGTCESISDQMLKRKQPILGINLMCSIIRKLQVNPRQLTGVHAVLLQLCLSAHNMKPAIPFLIDEIDDFTSDIKGSECKNLLMYLYYGGMIFAALKRYQEAIYFFEACARVPATTLSHIMLEGYKKFVLICLIHLGEVPQPHKSAVQVVNRVLKPSSQAYTDLATAFVTHNPIELGNTISRNQDAFRRDDNYGLVKQVRSSQTKLNIQRLTKTFLTLSLADVASRVQLSSANEAEKYILAMIQEGEIYARINQRDGMVVFLDNKEKYDNHNVLNKVEQQISKCIELNKRLSDMNDKLATNPEFISKVVMTSSAGAEEEGASGSSTTANAAVTSAASSSSSSKAGPYNL